MDTTTDYLPEAIKDTVVLAMQAGRDEMARALADWLPTIATEDQMYRDGAGDALLMLIHSGATDPRRRAVYCVRHNPPGTQPTAHSETHDCVDPHYA